VSAEMGNRPRAVICPPAGDGRGRRRNPGTESFWSVSNPRLCRETNRRSTLPRTFRSAGLRCVLFPLTPALSPRERVSAGRALEGFDDPRSAGRLATILPLPRGEGRGEGEGTVLTTHPARIRPVAASTTNRA